MTTKKVYMLELYMKKYGFTQADMARVLHKSECNFTNKLNGRTKFFADEMLAIRNAINERAAANGDPALTTDEIFLLI